MYFLPPLLSTPAQVFVTVREMREGAPQEGDMLDQIELTLAMEAKSR